MEEPGRAPEEKPDGGEKADGGSAPSWRGARDAIGRHVPAWTVQVTAGLTVLVIGVVLGLRVGGSGGSTTTVRSTATITETISSRLGFTVENSVRGGVWSLASPITSGFAPRGERPVNAHRWLPNGDTVVARCARTGHPYQVELEGEYQTWRWYAELEDGSWLPMGGIQQTTEDGSQGLERC